MKQRIQRTALVSLVSVLALASQAVFAQNGSLQQLQSRFSAADTNHDGKLTKSEAKSGMPRVAQYFEQIDVENTGSVTLEQIESFMAKQKK